MVFQFSGCSVVFEVFFVLFGVSVVRGIFERSLVMFLFWMFFYFWPCQKAFGDNFVWVSQEIQEAA